MRRPLLPLVLIGGALIPALCASCAPSLSPKLRPAPWDPSGGSSGGWQVLDPYLAERVASLEARSPSLRGALDAIRARGPEVRIGTPEQVARAASWVGIGLAPQHLGEVLARPDSATGAPSLIIVRVDLRRLREIYGRSVPPRAWFSRQRAQTGFDALVETVLIHELWGHVVPLAGSPSVLCADPRPEEPELHSCAMVRENELRRELGLRRRATYAIDGGG